MKKKTESAKRKPEDPRGLAAVFDPLDTESFKESDREEEIRRAAAKQWSAQAAAKREPQKQIFLMELAQRGIVGPACKIAGISRSTAFYWRQDDPEFDRAWEDALEMARDLLEAEAYRRGMIGVPEPVFHQGEIVGEITKYSDRLLELSLRANRPNKFRERVDFFHGGRVEHVAVHVYIPSNGREVAAAPPTIQGRVSNGNGNGHDKDD